jgi:prophage regulatory protein
MIKMIISIYVDLKQVTEISTLSRSTIDREMKKGTFPRKIHISPRRVRWLRSEIEAWQRSREKLRYGGATDLSTIPPASWIPEGIYVSEVEPESSG